ncbi:12552_t:CDS:2, partial [Cetraspora pellucida]
VVIAVEEFELPKNLQDQFRKVISDVNNERLEILKHDVEKYRKKIEEVVEEYREKIEEQLNEFKEFDKKALKIDDFIHMIDLASSLIKELMNMNLKIPGASSNEISLVDKIDQNLLKWIEDCAKIARNFNQFYEGLNTFNKNDNLALFKIQEKLLAEVDDIRNHLTKNSEDLGSILHLIQKRSIKKKIDEDFHRIIQLKSVYDLTTKLEYIRSRLHFFDPTFIQKISDFWKKLTYELKLNNDLIKIFREKNDPYVKDYCLNRIVENLLEI